MDDKPNGRRLDFVRDVCRFRVGDPERLLWRVVVAGRSVLGVHFRLHQSWPYQVGDEPENGSRCRELREILTPVPEAFWVRS